MTAPRPDTVALATDLYGLTMGAAYLELGLDVRATFSLFVRRLPAHRNCLVFAGLEDALARLKALAFDGETVEDLTRTGHIDPEIARRFEGVRFTGDVWAMREGGVFFPDEPVLEVDAPVLEAQIVETTLLNAIHFPTLVASKAARCVASARGREVVEFGSRRTPGIEASLAVARACFIAGFASTSNVLAAKIYGIPVSGTVAHSFIELFDREIDAFRAFAKTATGPVTLLVDTYDTLTGVARAIQVAREVEAEGKRIDALRLDSGDLVALSRAARAMLDEAGFRDIELFASGGLDEYAIDALVRSGAPIDGFGVGTRVGMSADAPVLDMAYKLVGSDGRPRLKLSEGKETLVLPKQVYRKVGDGVCVEDVIATRDEPAPGPDWEPLLERIVKDGQIAPRPSLDATRASCRGELARFPPELLLPGDRAGYRVRRSPELAKRQQAAIAELRARAP